MPDIVYLKFSVSHIIFKIRKIIVQKENMSFWAGRNDENVSKHAFMPFRAHIFYFSGIRVSRLLGK